MAQPLEPSPPEAGTQGALRSVPLRRDWHDARLGVALGCTLVGVSWLLLAVTHPQVAGWERGLFRTVNDLPDPLRLLLWLPMQLGSSWAWMLALPVLTIVYRRLAPGLAVEATAPDGTIEAVSVEGSAAAASTIVRLVPPTSVTTAGLEQSMASTSAMGNPS